MSERIKSKGGEHVETRQRVPDPRQPGETVVFSRVPVVPSGRIPESRRPLREEQYNPDLGLLKMGDSGEWTRWIQNRHAGLIYSTSRQVNNRDVAEEIVQEAWTRIYRSITKDGSLVVDVNMNGLLQVTVRNLRKDHYKSGKRHEVATDFSVDQEHNNIPDPQDVAGIVLSGIENEALASGLEKAINKLTPQQQLIIQGLLTEQSISETAEIANNTDGGVRALRHRAIGALSRSLQQDGIVGSEDYSPTVSQRTLLKGYSTRKLAHLTGISQPTVIRILSGKLTKPESLVKFIDNLRSQGVAQGELAIFEARLAAMKKK